MATGVEKSAKFHMEYEIRGFSAMLANFCALHNICDKDMTFSYDSFTDCLKILIETEYHNLAE